MFVASKTSYWSMSEQEEAAPVSNGVTKHSSGGTVVSVKISFVKVVNAFH